MWFSPVIDHKLAAAGLVIISAMVAALVTACGTSGGGRAGPDAGITTGSGGAVKVALLLPISASGSTPAVAKALKQAAELALFDFNNPSVSLVPKDTHGTPDGARAAAESAIHDGAELIIGPLFAQEVTAAAPVAHQAGVPMIAFSTDEKVAGNGVYLLSFLAGRDVSRIVGFTLARGKRNFAVLVPQSPYGRVAEAAFARVVTQGGGQAAVRATYPPDDASAMLGPVRQIANAIKSGQQIDAIFIPAGKEELPSLAPLLTSSDVTSARVQLIGTGQWDYPNIGSEKALVGGWYPAPDPKGWSSFTERYSKTYGDTAASHREPGLRRGKLGGVALAEPGWSTLHAHAAHARQRLPGCRWPVPPASRRHVGTGSRHPRSGRIRAKDPGARAEQFHQRFDTVLGDARRARQAASSTISRSSTRRPAGVAARRSPTRRSKPCACSVPHLRRVEDRGHRCRKAALRRYPRRGEDP